MKKKSDARSASKILDAAVTFVEDIVINAKRQEDHGEDCNCDDCRFLRAQADGEVCATCGCLVGHGCPCSDDNS